MCMISIFLFQSVISYNSIKLDVVEEESKFIQPNIVVNEPIVINAEQTKSPLLTKEEGDYVSKKVVTTLLTEEANLHNTEEVHDVAPFYPLTVDGYISSRSNAKTMIWKFLSLFYKKYFSDKYTTLEDFITGYISPLLIRTSMTVPMSKDVFDKITPDVSPEDIYKESSQVDKIKAHFMNNLEPHALATMLRYEDLKIGQTYWSDITNDSVVWERQLASIERRDTFHDFLENGAYFNAKHKETGIATFLLPGVYFAKYTEIEEATNSVIFQKLLEEYEYFELIKSEFSKDLKQVIKSHENWESIPPLEQFKLFIAQNYCVMSEEMSEEYIDCLETIQENINFFLGEEKDRLITPINDGMDEENTSIIISYLLYFCTKYWLVMRDDICRKSYSIDYYNLTDHIKIPSLIDSLFSRAPQILLQSLVSEIKNWSFLYTPAIVPVTKDIYTRYINSVHDVGEECSFYSINYTKVFTFPKERIRAPEKKDTGSQLGWRLTHVIEDLAISKELEDYIDDSIPHEEFIKASVDSCFLIVYWYLVTELIEKSCDQKSRIFDINEFYELYINHPFIKPILSEFSVEKMFKVFNFSRKSPGGPFDICENVNKRNRGILSLFYESGEALIRSE